MTTDTVTLAVDDLRRARRRRRIGDVAWGDLAYRVYTTTLGCFIFAVFASGWVGDHEASRSATAEVARLGPVWAGLAASFLVLLGVRSGARGGPLALEAADVYHLLLAPVDRSRVLRRPAVGVIGYGMAGGAAAGGLAGALCSQRLPGNNAEWIASGALFGATVMAVTLGAALLAASRRVDARIVVGVCLAMFLWSVAQVADVVTFAPFTPIGKIMFWSLGVDLIGLMWVVIGAAVCFGGLVWLRGLSIEAAQRRTRLVGQLRFAVTQQDLRSVLLLRRQLSSERPRNKSRIRRLPLGIGSRFPEFARDVHSFARWPYVRLLRVALLAVAAGLACRGVWSGTTPLLLVAGLATYVAALDAIEPLAQEIDHPMMLESYPLSAGEVMQRHLVAPVLMMGAVGVLGVFAAWVVDPSLDAAAIGAITLVTASFTAVAGASISVVSEAVVDAADAAMMPPEVAGPRVIFRMIWPPLVAILGFVPVLAGQRAMRAGNDPIGAALMTGALTLGLVGIVFVWVRYREDMHRSMNEAMGGKR